MVMALLSTIIRHVILAENFFNRPPAAADHLVTLGELSSSLFMFLLGRSGQYTTAALLIVKYWSVCDDSVE